MIEVDTTASERAERRHKATQRYIRVVVTVAALLLITMGFIAMVFSIQSNLAAQDSRARLLECTTPGPDKPTVDNGGRTGHACYDSSQGRTGEAIDVILDGIDWKICHRIQQSFDQVTVIEQVTLDCNVQVPPPPSTTTTTEGR